MTGHKQVIPGPIKAYAAESTILFKEIEAKLRMLVEQTAGSTYEGPNALEFKTKTSNYALEFAATCSSNMLAMSEAIQHATSGIQLALGGTAIVIEVPSVAVDAPHIQTRDDGGVVANEGSLKGLMADVKTSFNSIGELFDHNYRNFNALNGEAWQGVEFDTANANMNQITERARIATTESSARMIADIQQQLDALNMG